ncbi:hypothetical protein FQR65_LT06338 [Abscondita terminalis]|nr:hypothetical protein FQR65_LT06338 [Abscondita terminalis]
MRNCIVAFCTNRGRIAGVRYFRLTDRRRDRWLHALGRNTEIISSDSSICSNHFRSEDFMDANFTVLKPDAIPLLHLKPTLLPSCKLRKEASSNPVSVFSTLSTRQTILPLQSQLFQCGIKDLEVDGLSRSSNNSRKPEQAICESPTDREGLNGNLNKHRSLVKLMHNYSLTSRKLSGCVDKLTDRRRDRWLHALGRNTEIISSDSSICSNHFRSEDFMDANFTVLKPDAIPLLHLKPTLLPSCKLRKEASSNPVSVFSTLSTRQTILPLQSQLFQCGIKDLEVDGLSRSSNNSRKPEQAIYESPTDREGLNGNLNKHRSLVKLMHNYSLTSRKLSGCVDKLRRKNV